MKNINFLVIAFIFVLSSFNKAEAFAIRGNGGHSIRFGLDGLLSLDIYEGYVKIPGFKPVYAKSEDLEKKVAELIQRSEKLKITEPSGLAYLTIKDVLYKLNKYRFCTDQDYHLPNVSYSFENDPYINNSPNYNQGDGQEIRLVFLNFYDLEKKQLVDFCSNKPMNGFPDANEPSVLLLHEYLFIYYNFHGQTPTSAEIRSIVQRIMQN